MTYEKSSLWRLNWYVWPVAGCFELKSWISALWDPHVAYDWDYDNIYKHSYMSQLRHVFDVHKVRSKIIFALDLYNNSAK